MGKVIEFPDPTDTLEYINDVDGECIIGVADSESGIKVFSVDDNTVIVEIAYKAEFIPKQSLRELMIAWLALNYPDVIKWDED